MNRPVVAVFDFPFPTMDPTRQILAKIDAELIIAKEPKLEAILEVARVADAVLVAYLRSRQR